LLVKLSLVACRCPFIAVMSYARTATGESWQLILMDCAKPTTKCDMNSDNAGQNCGSPLVAYPYFISFYILCSFLVRLNYLSVLRFVMRHSAVRRRYHLSVGPFVRQSVTSWYPVTTNAHRITRFSPVSDAGTDFVIPTFVH